MSLLCLGPTLHAYSFKQKVPFVEHFELRVSPTTALTSRPPLPSPRPPCTNIQQSEGYGFFWRLLVFSAF